MIGFDALVSIEEKGRSAVDLGHIDKAQKWRRLLFQVASISIVFVSGCGSDACVPLDAAAFLACDDPNACLSVSATWCLRDCGNEDVNLSLHLPGGADVVGVGDGEKIFADGCTHGPDEQANTTDRPYAENITCSAPLESGRYVVEVTENSKYNSLVPGDIRIDINVDGGTSCQIVNIDETRQAEIELDYP